MTPDHMIFNAHENCVITWKDFKYQCALGKQGVISADEKREGDNKSPIGHWPMRRVFYRPDRVSCPETELETVAIKNDMGWSDDAKDTKNYNKLVALPYSFSHEKLWRDDNVYDIIVELGYNDDPPIAGKGSAIFMHVKRNDYEGTEGCVALDINHLKQLLKDAKPGDVVCIGSF